MPVATASRTQRRTKPCRLGDFEYTVPEHLVAKYPAEPRDSARMMVLHRDTGVIEHRRVSDLPEYFGADDVLVTNDTQVFPARLPRVRKSTGGDVEMMLVRELNMETRLWDALVEPPRKVRAGNVLLIEDGEEEVAVEVIDNTSSRGRTVRFVFNGSPEALYRLIDRVGETPIPPYIDRGVEPADRERYQTIFAKRRGAVAAPEAGLHFSRDLVDAIRENGARQTSVTLHAGPDFHRPVEVDDPSRHTLRSEYYSVGQETTGLVNRALQTDGAIVTACGTTVIRAMESSLTVEGMLRLSSGWTDAFIYPPYEVQVAQRLFTNFHRPRSTHLMIASAFAGMELIREAYEEAFEEEYRLYSFGDAMLIL